MVRGGEGGEGRWCWVGKGGGRRRKREGGSGRQCSGKKLRGKSKVRTINGLGRGSVGILSRCSTETEEDPGKMMKPVCGSRPSTEGSLKAAVKALNQAIRLRMISSSRLVVDIEEAAKMEPKGRGELWATIRGDNGRHAKP